MRIKAEQCARDLLETVPLVMQSIRDQVRRRRTAGLSLPQFRALAFLSRNKNASLSTAADHLGLSLPAMSRLVNGLVTRNLVERRTVAANRRQIALALTVRGRTILEKVRGEIRLQLADSLKVLSPADKVNLHHVLGALHHIFAPSPGGENQSSRITS